MRLIELPFDLWPGNALAVAPWTVSTNTAFPPTNAQQEFRVRLRHTNFWGLR